MEVEKISTFYCGEQKWPWRFQAGRAGFCPRALYHIVLCAADPDLTVFLVQPFYLPSKVSVLEHIVVELVPVAQRRESWPWELGKRTKVQTIDGQ